MMLSAQHLQHCDIMQEWKRKRHAGTFVDTGQHIKHQECHVLDWTVCILFFAMSVFNYYSMFFSSTLPAHLHSQ